MIVWDYVDGWFEGEEVILFELCERMNKIAKWRVLVGAW
jgi:hypothetical protein